MWWAAYLLRSAQGLATGLSLEGGCAGWAALQDLA